MYTSGRSERGRNNGGWMKGPSPSARTKREVRAEESEVHEQLKPIEANAKVKLTSVFDVWHLAGDRSRDGNRL